MGHSDYYYTLDESTEELVTIIMVSIAAGAWLCFCICGGIFACLPSDPPPPDLRPKQDPRELDVITGHTH